MPAPLLLSTPLTIALHALEVTNWRCPGSLGSQDLRFMLTITLREGERFFVGNAFCVTLKGIDRSVPKGAQIVVVSRPGRVQSARIMQVEDEMVLEANVALKILRFRSHGVLIGIRADASVPVFRERVCPAEMLRMWTKELESAPSRPDPT